MPRVCTSVPFILCIFSSGKLVSTVQILQDHCSLEVVEKMKKSFVIQVYLVFLYLCVSLSLLKRCLHCSASLVYRKCSKKTVAEGVASLMSLLFSDSVRTGLRVVMMIVFVNEMLLMRAGDVERNPGPGERLHMYVQSHTMWLTAEYFHTVNLGPDDLRCVRSAIYSVRSKWYDIGVELNISVERLNVIRRDYQNCADCLREMLVVWLSRTSPPPSWSGLVEALSIVPVGEKRLAEEIHTQYCVPSHDVIDSGGADTGTTGRVYDVVQH